MHDNLKVIHKVGLIGKYNLSKHTRILKKIFAYLKTQDVEIFMDENVAPILKQESMTKSQLLKKVDLAVTLGGDGTILKTARALGKKVVYCYGINLGTLGFLAESQPEKAIEGLERIFQGKYVLDKRSLLRVTVYRAGIKIHTGLALNDAVINQGIKARLIKLRLDMNQRKVNSFKSDGLIISTPTGSTGHGLSAGGPIVHPKLEAFVITPICPLSLSNRPIAMPNDRQLTITIETVRDNHEQLALTLDGQATIGLEYEDKVKVRRSSRKLYLIRMTGENYYKALRAKLHWGE